MTAFSFITCGLIFLILGLCIGYKVFAAALKNTESRVMQLTSELNRERAKATQAESQVTILRAALKNTQDWRQWVPPIPGLRWLL